MYLLTDECGIPLREAYPESKKSIEYKSQIKAVMFDLDDTLIHSTIDFMKLKRKTIDFYSSLGISPDTLFPNMKTHEILQKATSMLQKKGYTPREILCIVKKTSILWNQIELENISSTCPIEGAKKTLTTLKKQSRRYALKALKLTGLLEFVDVIVARDDCEKDKPDPEPLVHAMKAVGSKAEETIMIGDSITDFLCSKNAGVRFIGILHEDDGLKNLKRNMCVETIQDLRDLIDVLT
jgi:phosphoglycolate phosphatase-like HAD superfamily hydrolase